MNSFFKHGLCALLLTQGVAHAINPAQGWYAGIRFGGSYVPNVSLNVLEPVSGTVTSNTISYSPYVTGAIQGGYRFNQFRGEAEVMIDDSPYKTLKTPGYTFTTGSDNAGFKMSGQTVPIALMVNGYYDFFTPQGSTSFVPYVGLGIGYAYVKNKLSFYLNNTKITGAGFDESASSPAGQVIVGLSYYLDDYFSFALDYRYLTTKSIEPFNSRLQLNTVNLVLNGYFDCA